MDIVLDVADTFVFDRLYALALPARASNATTAGLDIDLSKSAAAAGQFNEAVNRYYPLAPSQWATASLLARDALPRQILSLFVLAWLFASSIYLIGSALMYWLAFDKKELQHSRFLRGQVGMEIRHAMSSVPVMAALTVPFFLGEVRGYSKLYDFRDQVPFTGYTLLQVVFFMMFTDTGIYWIHRSEHHPSVYWWLHKPHHRWIVPTPFASYAFHPLDGWAQSLPYHIYPFLFPLQKTVYLGLFAGVTIWTLFIRMLAPFSSLVSPWGLPANTLCR